MITVLGSGSWGTALAHVIAKSEHEVALWGLDLENFQLTASGLSNTKYLKGTLVSSKIKLISDLKTAVTSVKDLLIAVPSHAFRDLLQHIKPYITKQHRIAWATKGLDQTSGKLLHEVVEEFFGDISYGLISGPSFAKEVADNIPTAVALATNNAEFTRDLMRYLHNDTFRVYISDDIIGMQIGAIIKNIIAVAAGVSDGLNYGANTKAAIITRGLNEMMRFGKCMHAKLNTLMGLSGCGDVILTCTDNQSRNRRFGILLAQGYSVLEAEQQIGEVIEAKYNVAVVVKLANNFGIELPIVNAVNAILNHHKSPQSVVKEFLQRSPKTEQV